MVDIFSKGCGTLRIAIFIVFGGILQKQAFKLSMKWVKNIAFKR